MDTERATGIESTGPTDGVSNDELLTRIEALETRVDEQNKRIEELEDENTELRERVEESEREADFLLDDVCDIERQLREIDASGSVGNETGESPPRQDMTPIERVSKMNAEDTGIEVTPSIERAVMIFDHWREWSAKTPKGRVWKSGQKTLLRTATGEKLAWNQVYRAFESIDELSKGEIQYIDHKRHGKMLIEPSQAGTTDADLHASSVGA